MFIKNKKLRDGYVLLITVLTVGVVTSASAIAILLLGLSIERNSLAIQFSDQAYGNVWSCMESAILELKSDLEYQGNDELNVSYAYLNNSAIEYGYSKCKVYPVGGAWNTDRTICVESSFGNFTRRRMQATFSRILPDIKISSWEEVDTITLCDPFIPPQCGDNVVQTSLSEECDDGGESASCNADCTNQQCGDNIINASAGEQCDAGGETTACDANCTFASCGDGDINTALGEECDDSNTVSGDGCSSLCIVEYCGDSITNNSEDCDDGAVDTASCNADCTTSTCGDGYTNTVDGEVCDDSGESATCDADCSAVQCGDSEVNTSAGEVCDDGGESSSCDDDCTLPVCGDGNLNTADGEQCDDGNLVDGDGCSSTCTTASCGNGSIETGEDCDDSGESATCDNDCTAVACGDGNLNTSAGEVCDESGEAPTCDDDCTSVSCGDSNVNQEAGEACDDGGESATCNSDCTSVVCGDGITNTTAGEECDDSNATSGDGCSATCQNETAPTDYIGYWDLDESSKTSHAYDSSGNGYTCSKRNNPDVSTSTPTPPSSSYSRDFNGSNEYLRCTNAAMASSAVSVSFWTNNNVTPVQYDGLLGKSNSSWNRGWGFYYNSSSQIRFFIEDFSSNRAYASISPTSQWNHIVGTWDGSTIRIYVNGVEGTSDAYSGTMTDNQRLTLGRLGSNSYNINGKLDDVKMYDYALEIGEIQALYNGG